MKMIDLGGSGVMASALAVGCMRVKTLSVEELSTLVHTALEQGINFFDNANIYGGSGACETLLGKVFASEPGLRDRLLLQSKCGICPGVMYNLSKEYILQCVDESLQRLHTDHLDFLLLHRPDVLMEPEEIGEAFQRLEAEGKVLRFGVSNFNTRQLELLQSGVKQKLLLNQMQFGILSAGMISHALEVNSQRPNAADRDGELLDYCRLKKVTIQAWSPMQYGAIEGTFLDNDKFPELNQKLQELGEKYGVTKSAMAAAWILRHPAKIQVILGTTKPDRLKEYCAACGVELSREDWYQIYKAAGNKLP